jgi:hypothetical protein
VEFLLTPAHIVTVSALRRLLWGLGEIPEAIVEPFAACFVGGLYPAAHTRKPRQSDTGADLSLQH